MYSGEMSHCNIQQWCHVKFYEEAEITINMVYGKLCLGTLLQTQINFNPSMAWMINYIHYEV